MTYIPGDNWVICDTCGRKIRRSESKKTWDKRIVCHNDFEERHKQELMSPIPERLYVNDARPRPVDRELETNEVTQDSL